MVVESIESPKTIELIITENIVPKSNIDVSDCSKLVEKCSCKKECKWKLDANRLIINADMNKIQVKEFLMMLRWIGIELVKIVDKKTKPAKIARKIYVVNERYFGALPKKDRLELNQEVILDENIKYHIRMAITDLCYGYIQSFEDKNKWKFQHFRLLKSNQDELLDICYSYINDTYLFGERFIEVRKKNTR